MSTNYYIKGYPEEEMDSPKWHLGKRYSEGQGKLGFIWATDLELMEFASKTYDLGFTAINDKPIINEYGDDFTISEFMNLALSCDIQDTNSVGKEFC